MSEERMFEQITHDVRALRDRVDSHVDSQVERLERIAKDISKIQIEIAGHRGRVAGLAASVSVLITVATGWFIKHLN